MAKIRRYWKNRKKKDYRYKVDEQTIDAVRAPKGFKLTRDKKAYERAVIPRKTSDAQNRGQALAQLRKLEEKRAKAERTLRQTRQPASIKKWQEKINRIQEKELEYVERLFKEQKLDKAYIERREIITTFILVYVAGKYTSEVTVHFTVPVQIAYVQGDEQQIPARIEREIFAAIQMNEGLQDLDSIEIDAIEGLA